MAKRRRAKGDGALYKRSSDGMWIGAVSLGYDATGKMRRKTVSSKNKATAQRKLRDLLQQVDEAGGQLPTAGMTVADWLNHWLDTIASQRVRPRTLDGYRGYVNTWLIPHLGRRRLDRLRPEHVRGLYLEMAKQGKSMATRRQAHAILSRALKVAAREGHIRRNPAELVDPPGTEVQHRTPLTLDEAHRVLAALDGDPLASRWAVALLAGLRQGEALGLRWEHVDLEAGTLRVVQAIQRQKGKGLVAVPPKSRSSVRTVPLVPPVAYALAEHRKQTGGVGYVWGGDKPTDPRRDWQQWRDLLDRAGVPGRPLHAARATTASLLSEAGVSDVVIAEILGHSQVQITREAYIKGNAELHRRAMAELERYLNPDAG